jgi:hypothetical protein
MAKITKTGKMSAIQHCHCCGEKVDPIFKGDDKAPDTWFWQECSVCEEIICDKCSDEAETAEQLHSHINPDSRVSWNCSDRVCVSCLQMPKVRNFLDVSSTVTAQSKTHRGH